MSEPTSWTRTAVIRTAPCQHANWRIQGRESVGFATCLDCGARVHLADALNALRDRMVAAIEAAEQRVKGLP
jgi:hypothetical protein